MLPVAMPTLPESSTHAGALDLPEGWSCVPRADPLSIGSALFQCLYSTPDSRSPDGSSKGEMSLSVPPQASWANPVVIWFPGASGESVIADSPGKKQVAGYLGQTAKDTLQKVIWVSLCPVSKKKQSWKDDPNDHKWILPLILGLHKHLNDKRLLADSARVHDIPQVHMMGFSKGGWWASHFCTVAQMRFLSVTILGGYPGTTADPDRDWQIAHSMRLKTLHLTVIAGTRDTLSPSDNYAAWYECGVCLIRI